MDGVKVGSAGVRESHCTATAGVRAFPVERSWISHTTLKSRHACLIFDSWDAYESAYFSSFPRELVGISGLKRSACCNFIIPLMLIIFWKINKLTLLIRITQICFDYNNFQLTWIPIIGSLWSSTGSNSIPLVTSYSKPYLFQWIMKKEEAIIPVSNTNTAFQI